MVAIRAEERAITDADAWVPDRGQYKARFDALLAEWFAIDARLYDVDEPVTRARVLAVARAAVAQAPKQADGVNRRPPSSPNGWLSPWRNTWRGRARYDPQGSQAAKG